MADSLFHKSFLSPTSHGQDKGFYLERARSSMHPDKFDQITDHGQRWPLTALALESGQAVELSELSELSCSFSDGKVGELDAMRRKLAEASAHRHTR